MLKSGRVRRLVQWQLRTLLALTTLLAIALALYMHWIDPYRVQFNARNQLEGIGGQVETAEAEPPWMVHVVGADRFHRVVEYRLRGSQMDDAQIAPLVDLPHLQRLYLSSTSVGDHGARYISHLKDLRRMSLWRTRLTDAGMPFIAQCSSLRVLDFHTTSVTDEGLAALSSLKNLRQLTLGGPICGTHLHVLAKLPRLARLDLRRTAVNFDELQQLAGSPLEQLWIADHLPARTAKPLGALPRLRDFHGQILGADDEAARLLAQCVDLRCINLKGYRLTDDGVAHLSSLSRLESIQLIGDLTDRTLLLLRPMRHLKQVTLSGRFSQEAIEAFSAAHPKIELTVCTLLPVEYYERQLQPLLGRQPTSSTPPAQKYELRPLISVERNSRRDRNTYPLGARIHFPATLADLQRLESLHEMLELIQLVPLPGYDDTRPDAPSSDADPTSAPSLEGIERFTQLRSLGIPRVRHEELARLEQLDGLRDLYITDNSLTDEEVSQLKLPHSLSRLVITSSRITDEGLARLRARYPNLSSVDQSQGKPGHSHWRSWNISHPDLSGLPAWGSSLTSVRLDNVRGTVDCDPLAQLPNLQHLVVDGYQPHEALWHLREPLPALQSLTLTQANDRELRQLKYCPALTRLHLDGTAVSDNGLRQLVHLPDLQELSLAVKWSYRGPWITGRGLKHLQHCSKLHTLDLRNTAVRGKYLTDLAALQHLRVLHLSKTNIDDEACRSLARLPALEILNLHRCDVTDAGMEHLAKCPRLQRLNVSYTDVTEAGLEHLAACRSLRTIELGGTSVTPEAQRTFSERFPNVRVRLR